MKMTGIEKGILWGMAALAVIIVLSVIAVNRSIKAEFGACPGLKDAVAQVWDGVKCAPR